MFKNKKKDGFWSIMLTAFCLCMGLITSVEAAISLLNGGEGGIKLFFGVVFLLIGAVRVSKAF